ncbi:MAG: sigma-70 family RNA polymerase sigma factor [Dysgonamonadaceae bacterium]|jgi:RNA polymerase sigma-70 factor (ECF subfamily)|nr:sigma-70 family RNA polymerase sigma factor [Dysgonamonadaceae bacterium]
MHFHISEEQLIIAGCRKNESWARKRLYELYAPTMMGVCIRYTNKEETAKDVLHEGFIKVFTKIDSFLEKGSFEGWMRRIFATTALEFLKNESFVTSEVEIAEQEENLDETVVERMSAEEIMKCISELSPGYRKIFNLHAIEGYSHAEIAKMLNIKEGSSRSQFAHARQVLQTKIKKLHTYKHAETAVI